MRWDMSGLGVVLFIYGCAWFVAGTVAVILLQYLFGW